MAPLARRIAGPQFLKSLCLAHVHILTSCPCHVNVNVMGAIINRKAGKRKPGEPADRHNIQIKLSDEKWAQFERDVDDASKGLGGRVGNGAYAQNAILSHARLFVFKQKVADLVASAPPWSVSVDVLRALLEAT